MAKKKQIPERIYGPHDIDDSKKGRSYCKFGCGCYWSRHGKKGGPIGLHPINSPCPNHLIRGEKLPGNQDHEEVVRQQYDGLVSHISDLTMIRRSLIGKLEALTIMLLEKDVPFEKIEEELKKAKPI